MLKVKKLFSAFVGMAIAANTLITMPFSAFADEETSRTYTYDGYDISYDVTNSWGNTEKISVTISNTGDSTIENWMLAYDDFNGDIDGIWDATVVEVETSFDFVFRPNSAQIEMLETILKSEGNLCTDPNTGKNVLGHLGYDENNNRIVIAEPSSKSYYNIEITGNNIGITNPMVISAWELYEGLINNNGVYPLSKIIFDGNGQHSFQ